MRELSRRSLVKLGAAALAFGGTPREAFAQSVERQTELTDEQRSTYSALLIAVADAARDGESPLSTDEAVARFAGWYGAGSPESRAAVDATLAELERRRFANGTREARAATLRGWRRALCCTADPRSPAPTERAAALASDAIGLASVPYAEPDGKPVPAL